MAKHWPLHGWHSFAVLFSETALSSEIIFKWHFFSWIISENEFSWFTSRKFANASVAVINAMFIKERFMSAPSVTRNVARNEQTESFNNLWIRTLVTSRYATAFHVTRPYRLPKNTRISSSNLFWRRFHSPAVHAVAFPNRIASVVKGNKNVNR